MCGRFTLTTTLADIKKAFNIAEVSGEYHTSYNIAPTQDVATVVQRDEANVLQVMRWGLIPVWAKDVAIGSRMINARAETLSEKASFKRPLKGQRCLILADGFYEWQKSRTGKVPMYIRLKSRSPFGFAGLYDTWKSPEGESILSCTIITTTPNDLLKPIHDRMPVILPASKYGQWLDPANQRVDALLSLLQPLTARGMEAYEVSRLVNSPHNNVPEVIRPVTAS